MAEAVEKRGDPDKVVPPIAPRRPSGYNGRFVLAYLLVVAVFAGMIGVFAYLVSRSESAAANNWSVYKPGGQKGFARAQKIADFVAPRYLRDGGPLANVVAQPLIVEDTAVDGIAISRPPSSTGVGGGFQRFEPADSTVAYVFCGYGTDCGLPEAGGAAADAETLLRRESLELALYTFKYWNDVDSIVALLPPTKETSPAIFLKRSAFKNQLSKPLAATLPAHDDKITVDSLSDIERSTVARLTANSFFLSKFQALPNRRALLVLAAGNG